MNLNVGYVLDPTTFVWVKGDGYGFKMFGTPVDFINKKMNLEIVRSSDFVFTLMLLVLIVIYSLAIFLADHWVVSNRGFSKNPFGFLKKIFKKKTKVEKNGIEENREDSLSKQGILSLYFAKTKNL